jgi:hypothetical protein
MGKRKKNGALALLFRNYFGSANLLSEISDPNPGGQFNYRVRVFKYLMNTGGKVSDPDPELPVHPDS